MANINSQKKRIRQDLKRNVRNKSLKSELKTTLKSIENGDVSSETKNQALKSLDVAFSKGVISKNYRDRNKSRFISISVIFRNYAFREGYIK